MATSSSALSTPTAVSPDAMLVERIAAISDRRALAELDSRHGMTLYAIAYTLLLDPDAADVAVAAALREAWRRAASFNGQVHSVGRWLSELTRLAARDQLRAAMASRRGLPARHTSAAPRPLPARARFGARAWASLRRTGMAAAVILLPILLA